MHFVKRLRKTLRPTAPATTTTTPTTLSISAAAGKLTWTLENTSIKGSAFTGNFGSAIFTGNNPPLSADIESGTFTLTLNPTSTELVLRQPNGSDFYTYNGNGAASAAMQGTYAGNWQRG